MVTPILPPQNPLGFLRPLPIILPKAGKFPYKCYQEKEENSNGSALTEEDKKEETKGKNSGENTRRQVTVKARAEKARNTKEEKLRQRAERAKQEKKVNSKDKQKNTKRGESANVKSEEGKERKAKGSRKRKCSLPPEPSEKNEETPCHPSARRELFKHIHIKPPPSLKDIDDEE